MLACVKPGVEDVVEQNADLSKRANLDEVLACALNKTNLEENMVFMQVIQVCLFFYWSFFVCGKERNVERGDVQSPSQYSYVIMIII